jgi:hypothetical protein
MSRLGDITANIFDLLDESDGSNVESGKKAQAALEQKKNAAAAALAPAKPVVAEKSAAQGKKPSGERRPFDKDRKPRADGENRPRPAGDRKPRSDRPPRPQGESPKEEGGHRFPRTERRPRKDGEPFVPRGNKREKDRSESGTGRGKEVQKNGAGKGSWGSNEEAAAAVEGVSVEQAEEELKKEGELPSESAQNEATEAKEAEPEEKWGKTLDDYLKEKKKSTATFELRKLEDDGALNGLTPLKRGDGDNEFMKVEKKQSEKKVKESNKKTVVPADQVLKFQAEKKERAPREDKPSRGGDRRGKGPNQAGEKRRPASNAQAPPTVDDKAFPSLSKA